MSLLKGWKYVAFVSTIVGGIGLAVYPVIIDPMLNVEKYKKIQEQTRAGVNQEAIQPGKQKTRKGESFKETHFSLLFILSKFFFVSKAHGRRRQRFLSFCLIFTSYLNKIQVILRDRLIRTLQEYTEFLKQVRKSLVLCKKLKIYKRANRRGASLLQFYLSLGERLTYIRAASICYSGCFLAGGFLFITFSLWRFIFTLRLLSDTTSSHPSELTRNHKDTSRFMMADQQFFLKWNDFQTNMVTSFRHLRDEKSFTDEAYHVTLIVDVVLFITRVVLILLSFVCCRVIVNEVTLACEGQTCKAHKMVLSACSPYFKALLEENPSKHPIIILKDVSYIHLQAILEFMYAGEVNVSQEQLPAFLKTADRLKVKGLAETPSSIKREG